MKKTYENIEKLLSSLFEGDEDSQQDVFNSLNTEGRDQLESFLELHPIIGEYIDNGGIPFEGDDLEFDNSLDKNAIGFDIFMNVLNEA